MKPSTVRDAYATWSSTYDTTYNLTRDLDEQVTRRLLAGLRVGAALELGCGTGKNSAFLAGLAHHLTAVDLTPAMLARAPVKTTGQPVDFVVADITHPWPWPHAAFDLIICNLILEHVADLAFVFAETRRVLRPGGRLYISELHPFKQYQGTQANFRAGPDTITIPAHVHHISDFWQLGRASGLDCTYLGEWRHEDDDRALPPRLLTLLFKRR